MCLTRFCSLSRPPSVSPLITSAPCSATAPPLKLSCIAIWSKSACADFIVSGKPRSFMFGRPAASVCSPPASGLTVISTAPFNSSFFVFAWSTALSARPETFSRSNVIGVVTLPTYISDDCFSH